MDGVHNLLLSMKDPSASLPIEPASGQESASSSQSKRIGIRGGLEVALRASSVVPSIDVSSAILCMALVYCSAIIGQDVVCRVFSFSL